MSSKASIVKEVVINQGQLCINDEIVFERSGVDLKEFLRICYQQLRIEYPKFFKMDLLCQLSFIGSEVLLKGTNLTERYPKESIGIVLSNAASSLDTDRRYHETINNPASYFPSPAVFVYTLPSIMCGEIAIRNGFQGENHFLVTEQYDADLIESTISTLFSQTPTQACIGGWVQVDGDGYELVMFLAERGS